MGECKEPFVSVVTPFYNTVAYLAECIESVLAQAHRNFEYVLLDNCSTDGSAEIAQRYAKLDERIRLLHNERLLPQVQNYNHALRQIDPGSRYCKIVQADDWIFPECLARMVAVAETDGSIGIVGAYRLQGAKVNNSGLPYTRETIPGMDVGRLNLLLDGSQIFGSATTVLFRSDIVRDRNPFYTESELFEDTDACFEILRDWHFGFVFQVETFERIENESISSGIAALDPAWFLAKLIRIVRYGPHFLAPGEFEQRRKSVEESYFRFIARNTLLFNEPVFWNYHKKGLAAIGIDLSHVFLRRYMVREVLDLLLNPKAAVGWFFRRIHRRSVELR